MKSVQLQADSLRTLALEAVSGRDFRKATFSGAQRGTPSPWIRVSLRPIKIRGERVLQFSYFDGRKTFTKNYQPAESAEPLAELLEIRFATIHISLRDEEVDIRTTKKGKIFARRNSLQASESNDPQPHNRVKDLPLPEGQANALLEAMGIVTSAGNVRPTMRAKYTQINEFLKHLKHVLDETDIASLDRPVEILDCGCGASYLTLAVHYYLNERLAIQARILGVDVNEEVIRKSTTRVEHLGSAGIRFQCGPIAAVEDKADIVIALHACDTATDDALARAVRSEARLILSVPCCHHALNRDLRARDQSTMIRSLLRHGILRERMADLLTDAFRAEALRIMGYKVDVVEFVSPEHTARNLMIRAVKGGNRGDGAAVRSYLEMRRFCGKAPVIETALGEEFQQILRLAHADEASVILPSERP
jgi:SAM-dependent methyltransferase